MSASAQTFVFLIALGALPALGQEQAGIDACVNELKTTGSPDAQYGVEVISSEFSEAGTLVTMRDAGGTSWSCIGYKDGTVGDLHVLEAADDGEGAMAGSSEAEGTTTTEQVQFAAGTSGALYNDTLSAGSSKRYVLGAREGQFLTVAIAPREPGISYQIFNPDDSFLLDMIDAGTDYEGQLWQSGDHVVEVINRGSGSASYRVTFGIE